MNYLHLSIGDVKGADDSFLIEEGEYYLPLVSLQVTKDRTTYVIGENRLPIPADWTHSHIRIKTIAVSKSFYSLDIYGLYYDLDDNSNPENISIGVSAESVNVESEDFSFSGKGVFRIKGFLSERELLALTADKLSNA